MNGFSKIIDAATRNEVLDSVSRPIYVGDVVAYCDTRVVGSGYHVKKGVVKEVLSDIGYIRIKDYRYGKNRFKANMCLKISGMYSAEEINNNEREVQEQLDKEKEAKKQKRMSAITVRYVLAAYQAGTGKDLEYGLVYIPCYSNPGKLISKPNYINSINKFKATREAKDINKLWVITGLSDFTEYTDETAKKLSYFGVAENKIGRAHV